MSYKVYRLHLIKQKEYLKGRKDRLVWASGGFNRPSLQDMIKGVTWEVNPMGTYIKSRDGKELKEIEIPSKEAKIRELIRVKSLRYLHSVGICDLHKNYRGVSKPLETEKEGCTCELYWSYKTGNI